MIKKDEKYRTSYEYELPSEKHILAMLRGGLPKGSEPEEILGDDYLLSTTTEEVILARCGRMAGIFVRLAFRMKGVIKKLPFVGSLAIATKEKILKGALHSRDISYLLNLDVNAFVRKCYEDLLERECNIAEFEEYQRLVCCGMPKEAALHIFITSEEFGKKFVVSGSGKYRSIYRRYVVKAKLKSIPVVGYILKLLLLPKNIYDFHAEQRISTANQRAENLEKTAIFMEALKIAGQLNDDVRTNIETIQEEAKKLEQQQQLTIEKTERTIQKQAELLAGLRNMEGKYDELSQNIEDAFSKNDAIVSDLREKENSFLKRSLRGKPICISDGILNKSSYIEELDLKEMPDANLKDTFFYCLGKVFRSESEASSDKEKVYFDIIREAYQRTKQKTFLDIGCGDGAFLKKLKGQGIVAQGVDYNTVAVNMAKGNGLDVVLDDAQEYLSKKKDATFSGISLFQVVEHMPFDYVMNLCGESYRKISTEGVFLLETINPYCYRRIGNYHIDPSHIFFPSPDAMKLLLEVCGFKNIKIIYYAPIEEEYCDEIEEHKYEGYCIVGWKK